MCVAAPSRVDRVAVACVAVAAPHPSRVPARAVRAAWKPSLTIKTLLMGIQHLLDDPNNADPAQEEPYRVYRDDPREYERKVREQVVKLRA